MVILCQPWVGIWTCWSVGQGDHPGQDDGRHPPADRSVAQSGILSLILCTPIAHCLCTMLLTKYTEGCYPGVCLPFSCGLTVWLLWGAQVDTADFITAVAVLCWLRALMAATLQQCQAAQLGYRYRYKFHWVISHETPPGRLSLRNVVHFTHLRTQS